MIYRCACGRIKTAQPFKSTLEKVMICDVCANRTPPTRPIFNHIPKHKLTVASRVRTLEILKRGSKT